MLLQGLPETGTAWPALVNPIVEAELQFPVRPEDPDEAALERYAEQAGMSSEGVGLGMVSNEAQRRIARSDLQRVIEYGAPSKLSELLDAISAALLTRRRQDRTILVYKNAALVAPLQEYLFAAANEYESQQCRHVQVQGGGEPEEPVANILQLLSEPIDVLSLHLDESWTDKQISELDKQRDRFMSREILFWLPAAQAERFLRGWEHLRQLCQLFVIEDELLGSLSAKEIRTELKGLEKERPTKDSPEAIRVHHLKILLKLLVQSKNT